MTPKRIAVQEQREVMDVQQAAEYLGIAPDTLYKYAGERRVPAFKLGNRWRFKRSHLEAWMDEKAYQNVLNIENHPALLIGDQKKNEETI